MSITIVDHPIAASSMGVLRDKTTGIERFRCHTKRIGLIVLSHAFEKLHTEETSVETPLGTSAAKIISSRVVFVPILRAGLSLLPPAMDLIPDAQVGYFGLQRNEQTALPEFYYQKLPKIEGACVFVLDPMLATGGSAKYAIEEILKHNPLSLTLVTLIAAPEGLSAIQKSFPNIHIITAAVDEKLNDKKFIMPGLGDFGDRYHGT